MLIVRAQSGNLVWVGAWEWHCMEWGVWAYIYSRELDSAKQVDDNALLTASRNAWNQSYFGLGFGRVTDEGSMRTCAIHNPKKRCH